MATYYLLLEILAIFVAGSFITYWFLNGLLNPFIEAVVDIVITCITTVSAFFLTPLIKTGQRIKQLINKIPLYIKGVLYVFIGSGVFVFDHYYNTKIFAEDQATFYPIGIMNKTYWVTETALWIGGFFLLLASYIVLKGIGSLFTYLFDRSIRITFKVYK